MNRRLLLLTSIAGVLALVLAVSRLTPSQTADAPQPLPPPAAPSAPAERSTALNPLEDMIPESFAAITQRPLFNPGRAPRAPQQPEPPPPVVAEAPPPAGPLGPRAEDYKLVAISSGPTGYVAALRILASGEVLYLREGQPVQSWTVMKISDTSVIIGSEQASIELALFPGGAPAATPAPVVGTPGPLPEDIESANDAYHAATEEMDPYANTEMPQ